MGDGLLRDDGMMYECCGAESDYNYFSTTARKIYNILPTKNQYGMKT